MSKPLMLQKVDAFLFEAKAYRFFEWYRPTICLLWASWIWLFGWEFLAMVAPAIYRPFGLARVLAVPFPPLADVAVVLWSCTILCFLVALNIATRWLAPLLMLVLLLIDVWLSSFYYPDPQIHMIWAVGFFTLVPKGASRRSSSLAFRATELIMVLVYFQAGLAKLLGGGWQWVWQATTVQTSWASFGEPFGLWLADQPWLARIGAPLTLLFELSFGLYYFFPRLRLPLWLAAVAFHLINTLSMYIVFAHLLVFPIVLLLAGPELIGGRRFGVLPLKTARRSKVARPSVFRAPEMPGSHP